MPVVAVGGIELGLDVIALCAIIVLLASELIARLLYQILSHLPQIFPITLLNNAVDWFATAVGELVGWLWDHCNPIKALLDWGTWIWQHVIIAIPGAVAAVVGAIQRVVTQVIPNTVNYAIGWLVNFAQGLFNTLRLWVELQLTNIIGEINNVIAYAQTLYNLAVAVAAAALHQVVINVEGALSALNAALHAAIAIGINTVESDLDALSKWLQGVIGAAVGVLTADLLALRNWILQSLLPSLLAIGAAVGVLAIDWGNWRVRCGDPMCNGFQDLLSMVTGLDAILSADLVIQLVNDIRNDPAGVADEVKSAVIDPVDAIASALGLPTRAA